MHDHTIVTTAVGDFFSVIRNMGGASGLVYGKGGPLDRIQPMGKGSDFPRIGLDRHILVVEGILAHLRGLNRWTRRNEQNDQNGKSDTH
jgi:hypothetical protein